MVMVIMTLFDEDDGFVHLVVTGEDANGDDNCSAYHLL